MNDWRETVQEVLDLQADSSMKTNPGPSIQWYTGQWLGDPTVQLMDWTAQGIHHHLLMVAWKGWDADGDPVPCSLPDDAELICALCHHPPGWPELWRQVSRAWKVYEGRIWNLGLCRSYLSQMQMRRKRKAAAYARWDKMQCTDDADALQLDALASKPPASASVVQCSSSSSSSSSSDSHTHGAAPAEDLAASALGLIENGRSTLWSPQDYAIARRWVTWYRSAGGWDALKRDLEEIGPSSAGKSGPASYVDAILKRHRDRGELGKIADIAKAARAAAQAKRELRPAPAGPKLLTLKELEARGAL